MPNNKKQFVIMITLVIIIVGGASVGLWKFYQAQNAPTNFVDSRNRSVTVPHHPERIVSMAPSITEIIFALDAQDRLVGVTTYCNYPVEAQNITKIGGFSTPNLEVLTTLNPDLIIAASYDAKSVETLEAANFTVVIIEKNSILGIIEGIREIANLIDAKPKGKELCDSLLARYNTIVAKTSQIAAQDKLKCYFEVWETPMIAGNQSFINDLIDKAGAINIFADINATYATVSNEVIITGNPDAIFITEHSAAWYSQTVCNRTGYSTINACKNQRVYSVEDDIYLRQGPRIIDALENMTLYLYPNIFK
jgi:iron complex transport system substrate-binding protein